MATRYALYIAQYGKAVDAGFGRRTWQMESNGADIVDLLPLCYLESRKRERNNTNASLIETTSKLNCFIRR